MGRWADCGDGVDMWEFDSEEERDAIKRLKITHFGAEAGRYIYGSVGTLDKPTPVWYFVNTDKDDPEKMQALLALCQIKYGDLLK